MENFCQTIVIFKLLFSDYLNILRSGAQPPTSYKASGSPVVARCPPPNKILRRPVKNDRHRCDRGRNVKRAMGSQIQTGIVFGNGVPTWFSKS